jgi:hypothetical protein
MWKRALFVACLCLCDNGSEARAQAAPAMTTFVDHLGDDRVGLRVAYEVRELLRLSKGYPLVPSAEAASLFIDLFTVDPFSTLDNGKNSGNATAIAFTVSIRSNRLRPYHVMTGILIYGADNSREAAQTIVARLDREVMSVMADAIADAQQRGGPDR